MKRALFLTVGWAALPAAVLAQPTFDEVAYATVPVTGGSFSLTMDIYQATSGAGPRPVVLWIHGGGWSGGTHNTVPSAVLGLRAQGITVVGVEYRLSGQAIFPAQIHDVKGAVRWLRAHAPQYNLDATRVAAWGSSAGGHLAALLATSGGVAELEGDTGGNAAFSSAVQASVDYFGPTDLINMNLDVATPPGSTIDHDAPGSPESKLIGFSGTNEGIGVLRANLLNPASPFPDKAHLAWLANPIAHIDAGDPPMYIGHGDSDTSVPNFQSVRLKNALDAAGVPATLRIAPGFGHGNLGSQTDAEAAAFLATALAAAPPCTAPRFRSAPRGIYCSCGPTNSVAHSIVQEIAAKDFVSGTLVRVAWKDLQPGPTTFNWTILDNELVRARQFNTKVALGIVNGPSAPTWLATQGAQMFNFTTPQGTAASMPVPWDPVYLSAWTALVTQLGAKYATDDTITLVHATHSTANGFEMQIPFWSTFTTQWNSIGYTAQREIDSWRTVVDSFVAAFPNTPVDVEVHPVLGSDQVAQDVWAYAHGAYPGSFGLLAAWWSQSNAATVYSGMHSLIQQSASSSFATVQLVTNATSNPNGFGTGGISGAFDLAYDDGVRYAEVWNQDLLNSSLQTLLRDTAARFGEKVEVCHLAAATLNAAPAGTGPIEYQWQRESSPGSGSFVNLLDGSSASWDGGVGSATVSGSASATLRIAPSTPRGLGAAHAIRYRCAATNACGSSSGPPISIRVLCPSVADVAAVGGAPGCDGLLGVDDVVFFLARFFAGDSAAADIAGLGGSPTPDGAITVDDIVAFLSAFFTGCG